MKLYIEQLTKDTNCYSFTNNNRKNLCWKLKKRK